MNEKHINEQELHQKIITLFDYRLFPTLMDMAVHVSKAEKDAIKDQLIVLQKAIYHLDAHLEAHWHTQAEKLCWHWDNISNALLAWGIDMTRVGAYVNHIKKYEKHELGLRAGKSPLRLDMEYFYFYKSCDVKLIRRLMYEKLDLFTKAGTLSDWRYYDLVTEVNDDAEDIWEDLDFINGNRVLLSLIQFGKEKTLRDFITFLEDMTIKAKERMDRNKKVPFIHTVYSQTIHRIEETKALLHENLGKIREEQWQQSLLLKFQPVLR